MVAPARHFYVDPTLAAVRKARQCNDSSLSVTSLLTFPLIDYAGDYVHPDGLDFSLHATDPGVDIEHTGQLVGWARKSLHQPGAPYSQTWGAFDIDGKTHRLPVGVTYFDPHDRISSQVYQLVKADALPGVSLEFHPVPGFTKSFGYRSPVDTHRDATEFLKAHVVRWTHCARPVNEGALITKSLKQVPEPLAKVLRDGKVGSEVLHPTIRKALTAYETASVTVPVRKSAMDTPDTVYDDATAAPDAPPVDTPPVDEPAEDEAPALGGVAGMYAKVQALLDAIDQNEADMQTSDDLGLRTFMEKMRDKVAAIAEEIKAKADAHDAKLNGGKKDESESPESEETPDVDMSTDDDGMMKAIRPAYRPILKSMRVKRFTAAEAAAAVQKAKEAETVVATETPADALERIRREDPAGYRKIQRAKSRRDDYPAVA